MSNDSTNPTNLGEKARIYALCGSEDVARAAVASLRSRIGDDRVLFPLAVAYGGLGEVDNALDFLDRAVKKRVIGLTATKVATDPIFEAARKDPRFRQILAPMKMPESAFVVR